MGEIPKNIESKQNETPRARLARILNLASDCTPKDLREALKNPVKIGTEGVEEILRVNKD